jgi:Cu-processing system permease protein
MFDGLVLFLSFQLADYPIEVPMVILTALNPVDLSRIFIILQLDVSAMLGYTGAIFRQFFGADWGMLAGLLLLGVWVAVPYLLSLRAFIRRDW